MAVKGFNEGAKSPLLFSWRLLALTGALLLSACRSTPDIPPFTASGYLADDGVVRLWRKDNNDGSVHLLAAFSPWSGDNTSVSDYRWQNDTLASVDYRLQSKQPEQVKVRFDDHGGLSFMQLEVNGQKQQLSSDQIALWQYRAAQMRNTSDALRAGRVVLRQGRWNPDGTITTCEGQIVQPEFDRRAQERLSERQRHAKARVSAAWLEAPEGTQLLLVANEDFCAWQPQPDTF
ncbi:DUF1481 domain-containing protein [Cronobacter dublinensis]|nr:DUF1481 domain-containing protein [Cronobacter dublinensis]